MVLADFSFHLLHLISVCAVGKDNGPRYDWCGMELRDIRGNGCGFSAEGEVEICRGSEERLHLRLVPVGCCYAASKVEHWPCGKD